ncbi:MAG: hypothetical protein EBU48_05650 [Burkholderiaceae bacterium]|nr:hypothetical protein [Burkholderiaceae bacterium]
MTKNEADQKAELSQEGLAEDLARADLYGLLASLFFQPPDQIMLDQIVASGKQEGGQAGEAPLEDVWMNLVGAAKNSKALDWKVEYDNSFLGVGKPNVFLYGCFLVCFVFSHSFDHNSFFIISTTRQSLHIFRRSSASPENA